MKSCVSNHFHFWQPQNIRTTSHVVSLFSGHPWICENGVAPDRALDPAVLSRLKQFSAMNKLKKMALKVVYVFGLQLPFSLQHHIV